MVILKGYENALLVLLVNSKMFTVLIIRFRFPQVVKDAMEKSKKALSGSDESELGDNSAKGDNHVEPIPESSSHSAAFPEESLEGMGQHTLIPIRLLLAVNQLKPQSIFLFM